MNGQIIPLTPRQQRFVEEYVVCGCGAEAARRAGYSERTAYQIAYENLRKPEIEAAIESVLKNLSKPGTEWQGCMNEGAVFARNWRSAH